MFMFGCTLAEHQRLNEGEGISMKINGEESVVRKVGDKITYEGCDVVFKTAMEPFLADNGYIQYQCVPYDATVRRDGNCFYYT